MFVICGVGVLIWCFVFDERWCIVYFVWVVDCEFFVWWCVCGWLVWCVGYVECLIDGVWLLMLCGVLWGVVEYYGLEFLILYWVLLWFCWEWGWVYFWVWYVWWWCVGVVYWIVGCCCCWVVCVGLRVVCRWNFMCLLYGLCWWLSVCWCWLVCCR